MSDDAKRHGTVCPFCAVGCRLTHDSDDSGRVRGVDGPANPDGRLCEKGLRAFDSVEDDDRLTTPLVRRAGDLVPVSWETALDRVVSGFEEIIVDRDPDALAFLGAPRCTNEENYLLQKLARTLGTNNVDNRARTCHAETARAAKRRLGFPATTNSLADLGRADVFLVVGANPAARQPVAFDGVVRPAVNDGATLVHVDPHQNETTRLADHHVAPRPDTDALVVTTLCALVAENGVDESFVRERTTGFEAFVASLGERDVAEDAAAADVDAETLRDVATVVADADRVAVLTGTGADETATADAVLNLLLLTGNLGRPGAGLYVLRGLNNEQGATDSGCAPDWLPGHQPVTDVAARERVGDEWGVAPPPTPGRSEHDLLSGFGDKIAGTLVVGENPAVSKRDPEWLADRLEALDLLVVHELFRNETTAHADVVLPVAAGVEKDGTVTNLDRQVQRVHAVHQPPPSVRTDFEVLRSLGCRLVGGFDYTGPSEVFEELQRVTPPYSGLSYEELATSSRRWPTKNAGDGTYLYTESFATDDGRAPFVASGVSSTDSTDRNGLRLVVGDRVGGFVSTAVGESDNRLTVHPDDAAAEGVEDGDPVVVSNDVARVEATAHVSEVIRPGVVYLHADTGDPLVRGEGSTVGIAPKTTGS